jgi:hypothetical protein
MLAAIASFSDMFSPLRFRAGSIKKTRRNAILRRAFEV